MILKQKYASVLTSRVLVLFCLSGLLVMNSCAEVQETKNSSEPTLADSLKSSSLPDQESENATITLYQEDRRSTLIFAEMIWSYTMKDSVVAKALTVDFFDSSGIANAHLVSDSGIILETRKLMIAIGSVRLVNEDSTILLTERLQWNNRTGMITSDEFVEIISKKDTLRGIGFETDRTMRNIKLHHQVEGSLSDESDLGSQSD